MAQKKKLILVLAMTALFVLSACSVNMVSSPTPDKEIDQELWNQDVSNDDFFAAQDDETSELSYHRNLICAGSSQSGYSVKCAVIDGNNALWLWDRSHSSSSKGIPEPEKIMDNVLSVSIDDTRIAVIKSDHTLWLWGDDIYGPEPVKVMDNIKYVSCNAGHMAAIKMDGSLWTWGKNGYGQLGNGQADYDEHTKPARVLENVNIVSCGHLFTAAIKADGSLWMWGDNSMGQLGNGRRGIPAYSDGSGCIQPSPTKIMDNAYMVDCGEDHVAVIKTDGSMWTWGSNEWGKLGNGNKGNATGGIYGNAVLTEPYKIMENVAEISCGTYNTAAVKTDGSLWMWGNNAYGTLGNGGAGNRPNSVKGYSQTEPLQILNNVSFASVGDRQTLVVMTDGTVWEWGTTDYDVNGNESINMTPIQIPGLTLSSAQLGMHENINLSNGTPEYDSHQNKDLNSYLLPTDTEYIDYADLEKFTSEEIVLIRNELYARHGYNFQDAEIRAYFNSQSWYEPIPGVDASAFDTAVFNDYERTNLETIVAYEREMGWRS